MKKIDAKITEYQQLKKIISLENEVTINNCLGQRFIGVGLKEKKIIINGIPGNALGAYLNGSQIYVNGNAQDAVGDTMNNGRIIIKGSVGDAVGYAMRGGEIYIKGKAGYRAGIHMKEYKDKKPIIVIGETAGSFLGEYQAGGIIIVLNINNEKAVGDFCGTGMHGGKIFLRTKNPPQDLPKQVKVELAKEAELEEIEPLIDNYCEFFGVNKEDVYNCPFFVLTPNSSNPYKQLYVAN